MKHSRLVPFDLPLALFWLSALLGLALVYDPALGLRTAIVLTGMTGLYVVVSRAARRDHRWDDYASLLVGLGALVALYFSTQAGHLPYEDKISLIDRAVKAVASIFPAFPFWQPLPNSLATFLEGCLFLAVGLAFVEKRPRWRILAWVLAGIIGVALIFSASRGAWLGVLAAGLLWAALYWKPARWLALLAAAVVLGSTLFVVIRGDINALAEIPIIGRLAGALFMRPDRLEVYNHSLALLSEQPFTGIGLGNAFALPYSRYELLLAVPYLYYSHNLLLEVWLQQGLPGATAFIWLVAALYAGLLRSPAIKHDLRLQAAAAGLTATLLHGLTDASQYPSLWTWLPFFLLLGLTAARLPSLNEPPNANRGWLLPAAAATLFVALVLAFTWPPNAAWYANRAGLLQTRADLSPSFTQEQRSAMRSESERLFLRALAADPESTPIHRRYGLLLLEEDRFAEALPHLELAYQAKPDHIAARKSLGLAYLWTGHLDRAHSLLAGMRNITNELKGLAWQEYNDYQQDQNALYTYRLLDQLEPGGDFTREMIALLEERLRD